MIAIILAAGYATRLYPLTKNQPKSLLPLGSKLIIDYIIDSIDKIRDISTIYLVTNDKFVSNFEQWNSKLNRSGKANIVIINDGTNSDENKLGAIGDIQLVVEKVKIDDDICVLAGDNIFNYDIEEMYRFFKEKQAPTLIAIRVPELHQRLKLAVAVIDDDNRIIDLEEKPDNPKSEWGIYATYFYGKEIIPLIRTYLDEGNSADAPGNFPAWLYKRLPMYAYKGEGECVDIGTLENYYKLYMEYDLKK